MIIDIIKDRDLDSLKEYLKSDKVDFNEEDKWGNFALNVSSDLGEFQITKLLLEYPFDINAKGLDNCTPLYYAVLGKYIDIVKILINKKADLDIPDKSGNTPLIIAVRMYDGNDNIIKILLDSGANPKAKNNAGNTLYKMLDMPKNKSIKDLFPPE